MFQNTFYSLTSTIQGGRGHKALCRAFGAGHRCGPLNRGGGTHGCSA